MIQKHSFLGAIMRTYEPMAGESIGKTCETLEQLATEHGDPVQAEFNGVMITASPGSTAGELETEWREETDRKRAEHEASPEYKRRQEAAERRDAGNKASLQAALVDAPPMEFADEQAWGEFTAKNADPYGVRVVRYAEEWARLMQARIANGGTIEDCAEGLSHLADDDGITGFMYGCAVSVLAKVWKHGEALRRWHNKEAQFGDEGDKANEDGGVLNPAILSVG